MKKLILVINILLAIILISCNQSPVPQNPQLNIPAFSPTVHQTPSQTWTPWPMATITTTPPTASMTPNASTATSQSWEATSGAYFLTSKAKSAATGVSADLTLEARNAKCKDDYNLLWPKEMANDLSQIITDDDQWIVVQCLPRLPDQQKGYTLIVNKEGSTVWQISYETLNVPYDYPFLTNYSVDISENYLYLIPGNTSLPGGGGPLASLANLFGSRRYGLYRLDLESGELNEILGEIEDAHYMDISISEDTHYLTWSTSVDLSTIYIQDLTNNKVSTINLNEEYKIVGAFNWSPDNKTLIFSANTYSFDEDKVEISLFKWEPGYTKPQVLLYKDHRNLIPSFNINMQKTWLNSDIINLASFSNKDRDFSSTKWAINIRTGEVIALPEPTSTPTQ